MENINDMTDLEMAEELHELKKIKLPRVKTHLQENTGNKDFIEQEYNKKLQRCKLLENSINYENINFNVNAKKFGLRLKDILAKENKNFVFGINKQHQLVLQVKNPKYVQAKAAKDTYVICNVDESVNRLEDVDIDVSSFYLGEVSDNFKYLLEIIKEKDLRKIVFDSLKECQSSKKVVTN